MYVLSGGGVSVAASSTWHTCRTIGLLQVNVYMYNMQCSFCLVYRIVSLACSYCTVLPRHRDHRLQCFIMHHASSCSSPFSFSFRLVSSTTIHSQFTTQHHTKYRRIAAIVGSVGVAVYGVLVAEYSFPGKEEEDHVFSHVQASFRGALDQYVYGIVPGSTSRTRNTTDTDGTVQAQQQQSTGNTKQPGDR
jgi:hypothetical protein